MIISADKALPGREDKMPVTNKHFVLGNRLTPPFDDSMECAQFGMGCFWGAEKCFWIMDGVYSTAVGYAAGYTPNPTYQEVCSGQTGHNEIVLVVYDPDKVTYLELLSKFWQSHNPTQYLRQGNDVGSQYRTGIYYYTDEQEQQARQSKIDYQQQLTDSGLGNIETEIDSASIFYYAEDYHQQYLAKNPGGYCGLGGTGVAF